MQRRWCFLKREDNEAVIKTIIKGRSPTMRHVSRTHRVALDRLFDRTNLDPKIQIKYVDTKNQLADILTKGNSTCDEWNNLLRLFNISIFSSASCPEAMSKTMQQRTEGARILRKSKPALNLVSHTAASSPTAPSSSAASRPGILRAPTQSARFESHSTKCRETCRWRFKSKWRSVKFTSVANRCKNERQCARTNQDLSFQECARKLAAENSDINDSEWPNNFHISRADVPRFEKVYSNLRQQLKNASQKTKWRTSMWTRWDGKCLWLPLSKPQFILETIILEKWQSTKNQPQRTVKQLFDVTRKLIKEQKEIQGISMIDWQQSSWKRTTLLSVRAVRLSQAKAYEFSDSVLCMGRISENPANAWKEKIKLVYEFIPVSRIGSNRRGADGVRVDKFTRIYCIADCRRDPEHDDWKEMWTWAISRKNHLHVNVQRHCMGRKRKQRNVCCELYKCGRTYKKICARTLVISWAWIREEMVRNSDVQADLKMGFVSAEDMMNNFIESGHHPFRGSSGLERGDWKAKEKGNCLYIAVVTTAQPNWFFARSFPWISSVSTKQ